MTKIMKPGIALCVVLGAFCLAQSLFAAVEVKLGKTKEKATMPTRAVAEATLPGIGVTFGKSVFSKGTGYFGDTAGGKGANALVSAALSGDASSYEIKPVELATVANNLKDASIAGLALDNGNPAVVTVGAPSKVVVVNRKDATVAITNNVTATQDAGGDAINAAPPALAVGIVGGRAVVISAVTDTRTEGGVKWVAGGGAVDPNVTARAAAGAVKTKVEAAPINATKANIAADLLQADIGVKTAIKTVIEDCADYTVAPGATLKVHDVVGAVVGQLNGAGGVVGAAATVLTPAIDDIKTLLTNKQVRLSDAAVTDPLTPGVDESWIANTVLTGNSAVPANVNPIDYAADTFVGGAAAALAAGAAWAVRSAPAVGAAGVEALFVAGEGALKFNEVGVKKPIAKYAADKLAGLANGAGTPQTVANAYIAFDKNVLTKPLTVRVFGAATEAKNKIDNPVPGHGADDVATKVYDALKPIFKVADGAAIDVAGGPEVALVVGEAKVGHAPGDAAALTAIAAAAAAGDTATNGAKAALEAVLARSIAGFHFECKNNLDAVVPPDETVVAGYTDIMNEVLPRLSGDAALNDKPIVRAAIGAVRNDAGAAIAGALADAGTGITAKVKDTVGAGVNSRIAQAAALINGYAVADQIGAIPNNFITPIKTAADVPGLGRPAITAEIDVALAPTMADASKLPAGADDPTTRANIVAKLLTDQATNVAAVGAGAAIVRADTPEAGAAIAIEAGTTWAIRNQSATADFPAGASTVHTLFGEAATDAATKLNTGYGAGGAKPIAAANANRANVAVVKNAAKAYIVFDAAVLDKPLTKRVLAAGAKTQGDALVAAGDHHGLAAAIKNALIAQYKIMGDDAKNIVPSQARLTAYASNPDNNAAKTALAAAAWNAPIAPNTDADNVTNGAIVALEAAAARGVGFYKLQTLDKNAAETQADSWKDNGTKDELLAAMKTAVANLKTELVNVAKRPVAAAVAKAVEEDLTKVPGAWNNATVHLLDKMTTVVNGVGAPANKRIAEAAKKVGDYIQANLIAKVALHDVGAPDPWNCLDDIAAAAGIAAAAIPQGGWRAPSTVLVADVSQIVKLGGPFNGAVDQAADAMANDTAVDGTGAAIEAALGWTIRKANIDTCNVNYAGLEAIVTEALTALESSNRWINHGVVHTQFQATHLAKPVVTLIKNNPAAVTALAKIAKAALLYTYGQNAKDVNFGTADAGVDDTIKTPTKTLADGLINPAAAPLALADVQGVFADAGAPANGLRIQNIALKGDVGLADKEAVAAVITDDQLVAALPGNKTFKEIVLDSTRGAVEACLGWGCRAATLDTPAADLENLLTNDVLNDATMQGKLDNTKNIAQDVVRTLKGNAATIAALKTAIKVGLVEGTGVAVDAVKGELKAAAAVPVVVGTANKVMDDVEHLFVADAVTVAALQPAVGTITTAHIKDVGDIARVQGASAGAVDKAVTTIAAAGANDAVTGAKAAVLAALGWGIRKATGDSTDAEIDLIVQEALTELAASQVALGAGGLIGANVAAIKAVNAIKDDAGAQGALRLAIKTALSKADEDIATGFAAAVPAAIKDAVVLASNNAVEITVANISGAVAADKIQAVAGINPAVAGNKSQDAALQAAVTNVTLKTDLVDTAKNVGIAAARTAIEAALGWGVRNTTMDKVWGENLAGANIAFPVHPATAFTNVEELFTKAAGASGILDGDMQGKILAANTNIAKAVVTAIANDGPSKTALAQTVMAGVLQGTTDAATAIASNLKDPAQVGGAYDITTAAATKLAVLPDDIRKGFGAAPLAPSRLDVGRVENAAVASEKAAMNPENDAADKAISVAVIAPAPGGYVVSDAAPVQAADDLTTGAIAALEASIGNVIGQLKKENANSIQHNAPRPWGARGYNDGDQRGFAVLAPNPAGAVLAPVPQDGGGGHEHALKLTLKVPEDSTDVKRADIRDAFKIGTNNGGIADVGIEKAFLGGAGLCMHWDDNLGVFVGLQGARRGEIDNPGGAHEGIKASDKEGGIIGVSVGTVDPANDKVAFKPILAATPIGGDRTSAILTNALKGQQIVGFYSVAHANDMQTSIWNMRTMHTSTGRDYLIVNGDTRSEADVEKSRSWVYALPVMPEDDANAGQLAKKDFIAVASVVGDLYTVRQGQDIDTFNDDEKKVVVGRDPRLIGGDETGVGALGPDIDHVTDISLQSMEIIGDTVYVAVAGYIDPEGVAPDVARRANVVGSENKKKVESGIFQSTAIFDADGLIVNWTPWKRVGGTPDAAAGFEKVYGFGMEPTAATTLLLTGAQDTIKSTAWGKSVDVSPGANRRLSDVLESDDVFGKNGFQLFNFDENTPGFAPGKFAMMVAVGPDRVALIQTGHWNATHFDPTTEFKVYNAAAAVNDQNVFVFKASDYQDLQDIMPLTCAEVLRDAANANKGYLYVGGYRGLARLELAAGGNGWDGAGAPLERLTGAWAGALANSFPRGKTGIGPLGAEAWKFKKLDDWNGTCVIGIAGGGADIDHAKSVQVLSLEKVTRAAHDGSMKDPLAVNKALDSAAGQFGCDMVLVNNKVIAATTDGLYVAKADFTQDPAHKDYAKINTAADPAFPTDNEVPVQLAYISSDLSVNSEKGDLYVLTANRTNAESKIYRFAVDTSAAVPNLADVVKPIAHQDGKFPMTFSGANMASKFATDGSVLLTVRPVRQGVTKVVSVGVMHGGGADDIKPLENSKLNVDLTPNASMNTQAAYIATPVKDTTTGTWVIPGDFGARVNE